MTNTPNPGSDDALEQGCKCPVMDNAKGRGAWGTNGDDAVFWVSPRCPVHNPVRKRISEKQQEAMDELTRLGQEMGDYD